MSDLIEELLQMADDLDPELRPALLGAADEIERLRAALGDMAQDWCCRHPNDTHVEVLMPVELFKEFRDE